MAPARVGVVMEPPGGEAPGRLVDRLRNSFDRRKGTLVRALFETHAGKATVAIVLGVLIIAWPIALNFLTALLLLVYGIVTFRMSFDVIDTELRAAAKPDDDTQENEGDSNHG